ncbi:cytochrome c-type biogenesis protein CcmH [Pelagibacteraceae bacterium]|nr:cytochrome c-type biogenesis protein CcmH [Pelagibacteraceae bacterium]
MKLFSYLIIFILILSQNILSDDITQKEIKIYKNLRCLVCQGQSIADSNSDFAQTIKLVIKDKINENKTEDEIYNFLSSRYGDWIVYKPRFNSNSFLLWVLPYLFLIIGGIVIFNLIKKRKNNSNY